MEIFIGIGIRVLYLRHQLELLYNVPIFNVVGVISAEKNNLLLDLYQNISGHRSEGIK